MLPKPGVAKPTPVSPQFSAHSRTQACSAAPSGPPKKYTDRAGLLLEVLRRSNNDDPATRSGSSTCDKRAQATTGQPSAKLKSLCKTEARNALSFMQATAKFKLGVDIKQRLRSLTAFRVASSASASVRASNGRPRTHRTCREKSGGVSTETFDFIGLTFSPRRHLFTSDQIQCSRAAPAYPEFLGLPVCHRFLTGCSLNETRTVQRRSLGESCWRACRCAPPQGYRQLCANSKFRSRYFLGQARPRSLESIRWLSSKFETVNVKRKSTFAARGW